MPPLFFFRGPPLEFLLTELVYFLIVFILCILIFSRTNSIYQLTKHKGIFHFRNIFLFFSLAYLFRLVFISFSLSAEFTDIFLPRLIGFLLLTFISFFSTMAILSMVTAVLIRRLKKISGLLYWLLGISLLISSVTFVTRSHRELLLLQTVVFLFTVMLVFYRSRKIREYHLVTQNNLTYLLLFVFWVLNVISFDRRLVPYEYKIPLYILSAAVFFWVYWRVKKRLEGNAKKKG